MSNVTTVRKLFKAMAEGRVDDAFELLSDDIQWRIAGDLPFCGPHVGKKALKADLFAPINALYVPGTTKIEIVDMLEDVARSAVITRIRESSDLVGGGHTEVEIASFMFLANGKVERVQEYVDLRPVVQVMKPS